MQSPGGFTHCPLQRALGFGKRQCQDSNSVEDSGVCVADRERTERKCCAEVP